MIYMQHKSRYNRYPETKIDGHVHRGMSEIKNLIQQKQAKKIVFECYPGVNLTAIKEALSNEFPLYSLVFADEYTKKNAEIKEMFAKYLTDDRVFGNICPYTIDDIYSRLGIDSLKAYTKLHDFVIVYGFGASLIEDYDLLFYIDITRWEIQQRYRHQNLQNWKSANEENDRLKKFKYGYFIEWRIADRLKQSIWDKTDYYIDAVDSNNLKCVSKKDLDFALHKIANQPFRFVPYFDQGVWGGEWMKEVCNLDFSEDKFAWCFDGVAEENSLRFRFDNEFIETPAINLVLFESEALLGNQIIEIFGKDFPIRFDLLDTMEGQNLSLQVHPNNQYIKENFGMKYTQDESYYILDAKEDSVVYLGLKNGANLDELINDLKLAQETNFFDDTKYINKFPVKKHDHISIPNGTIHCSGKNTMVLEISSTPYIFTFKLWDWNRIGLDGKPRPIHINHGKNVIDQSKDTNWVSRELLNKTKVIQKSDEYIEEITGLHPSEFIETRRHTFTGQVEHDTLGTLNILNLVEGDALIVESPTQAFQPYVVHFAETFIIPASVGRYTIKPFDCNNKKIHKTIKAFIR